MPLISFCVWGGANWEKETCPCMNNYLNFQVSAVLYPLWKKLLGEFWDLWTNTKQHRA